MAEEPAKELEDVVEEAEDVAEEAEDVAEEAEGVVEEPEGEAEELKGMIAQYYQGVCYIMWVCADTQVVWFPGLLVGWSSKVHWKGLGTRLILEYMLLLGLYLLQWSSLEITCNQELS